jgi:hypothetical protein
MRTPVAAEFQSVDQPGGSTAPVKRRAHECFHGARLLLGALFISIAIWAGLGWGLSVLVRGM